MPSLDTLVIQAEVVVNNLENKLKQIEEIHKDILRLIEKSKDLPVIYDERYNELHNLSEKYINSFNESVSGYIDSNNKITIERLKEFSLELQTLEKEINRLINTDFKKLFEELQRTFIAQTRKDVDVELKKFEEKSFALQTKVDSLQTQIERLEKVDLEKHFDKLQKTLADIFGAINSINLTLTNVVTTLTGIVETLNSLKISISTKNKELQNLINSSTNLIKNHLSQHDIQFKMLKERNEEISRQNIYLLKQIKNNRIIQLIGMIITISLLVYIVLKKC